ncbi:MAG TPA: hypothetical protein VJ180_03535 [Pyrinomonadaceae bacterium]|nr:hypothetical protein [Pyrinomonadaceae bacterium]
MTHRIPLLSLVCILSLGLGANGQTSSTKKEPSKKAAKANSAKIEQVDSEEEDAVAAQRRLVAISLLTTLAEDAHSFRDQKLRARVQARAADALWESDTEKARALFRRAWENAGNADAEANKNQSEELRKLRASGGPVVMRGRPDIRNEVLRLVAKRDTELGEEFLKTLEEAVERDTKEADFELTRNGNSAAPSAAKRLQVARRLLEDGDVETALKFAGPVLDQVNRDSINFLSALREKNAQPADHRFLSLLARAELDPGSDANTVSGLSSYAFTPFIYITFSPDGGGNQMQERAGSQRPDVPAPVRAAFFRVATQILLRPSPPLDQDRTSAGRTGKFMVIRRLLPLFDEYEPEKAANLRAQMAALTADVPEGMRSGDNRAVTRGILPDDTSRDTLDAMQNRLDRARTSEDRDAIYADYATALAGKGDLRAKDLVDKIEDSEARKSVRGYTDFQFAQLAVRNKDIAEAMRIAKTGELSAIQRIWTYTRIARLLIDTDRPRAVEVLEAAGTEARRISGSDPDRPKGLMAVATGMIPGDRVRAWELITEAVKAANSAENFTGEDGNVSSRLQTRQMVLVTNASSEDFDLTGAFRALARDDFQRSIELAKSLTGEAARSLATLAIGRSALEKRSRETP